MKRSTRGFTLIELMMVVVIVGVLAGIAFPSYKIFTCRTKWSEAKTSLKSLSVHEEAYRSEYDSYLSGADAQTLFINGMVASMPSRRYAYSVPSADKISFVAEASGLTGTQVDGDLWTLDEAASLLHVSTSSGCSQ